MTVALLLYIIALLLAIVAPFIPDPTPRYRYAYSAALVLVIIASIIESGVKL